MVEPILINQNPQDSRYTLAADGVVNTLPSKMGTGGGNVPMIIQSFRKTEHPRNNEEAQGYEATETADTLNVFDNTDTRTPRVVCEPVGVDLYNQATTGEVSKALSHIATDSDHIPCVIEPVVAYTLKVRGGVLMDSKGKTAGKGALVQTELAGTISATQDQYLFQPKAFGLDRASFNQGQNAKYDFCILEETQPTLTSRGVGGVSHPISTDGRFPVRNGLQVGAKPTSRTGQIDSDEKLQF